VSARKIVGIFAAIASHDPAVQQAFQIRLPTVSSRIGRWHDCVQEICRSFRYAHHVSNRDTSASRSKFRTWIASRGSVLPENEKPADAAGLRRTLPSQEECLGAGEGIRTLDPDLGKVVLYH
jgi:hypothetical protein